ncbi:tyrosine-type recombinase/integrase [Halomonas sp. XH26]|uniref:tyrosine-type recombinase/integrase n=1 Tax=Halomonas sp. XH26 TaxID=2557993 RepID=UPI00209D7A9E|nr:tyrosine-type recombinase/integrase [Halomonas sp. XH26]UTA79251.1 tyrosine-type recombinase/integrase [Halomonas sp. XH26]
MPVDMTRSKIVYIQRLYRLDGALALSAEGIPTINWTNRTLHWNIDKDKFEETSDLMIERFPIIYRNCEPWDLGNLYLYRWWLNFAESSPRSIVTIDRKAKNLLSYLHFIEEHKTDDLPLDIFYAPPRSRKNQRVTYLYKSYLTRLFEQKQNTLQTVKQKAAEVAAFYMFLNDNKLTPPGEEIEDRFYTLKKNTVIVKGGRKFPVNYSDIHITKATVEETQFDLIQGEEGGVRPLSEKEVEWVLEGVEALSNRQMQLIVWLALYTGARKQTICTLSVEAIQKAYKSSRTAKEARIPVGPMTGVDTKGNVQYVLKVPSSLVAQVYDWVKYSEIYKERKEKSYYGDSSRNYVFLTKFGRPFYTANRHTYDAADPTYSMTLKRSERGQAGLQLGSSINDFVNQKLIPWIRQHKDAQYKGFKFHDLRATRGMRFVRQAKVLGMLDTEIITHVKGLLGHKHESTTMIYLRYDELVQLQKEKNKKVHEAMYGEAFPWDNFNV